MDFNSISKEILERITTEAKENVHQPTIGRSDILFQGKPKTLWVIRNQIERYWTKSYDIVGNPKSITSSEAEATLKGAVTFRDSKMGEILFKGIGKHSYDNPTTKQKVKVDIKSLATYIPNRHKGDAEDGKILLGDEEVNFESLRVKMKRLLELERGMVETEKELDKVSTDIVEAKTSELLELETRAEILRTDLEESKNEQAKLRQEISEFYRSEVELRARPFLDEYQDAIRRVNPLSGTLVIDGGPGTGKTTSLIQRITFLISPTIQEYLTNLTEQDKQLLANNESNWIFFSPSELLKLYLSTAMTVENLNPNRKVHEWHAYRSILMRQFELFRPGKKLPFRADTFDKLLFEKTSASIKWTTDSFLNFIVLAQKLKAEKALAISPSKYSWKELGMKITVILRDTSKLNSLGQWIRFYQSTKEEIGSEIVKIQKDYLEQIGKEVSQLQVLCNQHPTLIAWLTDTFNSEPLDAEEEDEDAEDVEIDDYTEEKEVSVNNEMAFKLKLNRKLRTLYRTLCLREFDKNTKFTKKNKVMFEEISKYVTMKRDTTIGEKAYFLKYFSYLKSGAEVNLLNTIPTNYKSWRRTELAKSIYMTKEGKGWLESDLKQKGNKLHRDEMDLILLSIFQSCKEIYSFNQATFNNSANKYLAAYRVSAKAVVAVDEATDMSLLELLCMNGLTHPRFNCLTLSGDIMQRMEQEGLKSWSELLEFIPDIQVKSMEISYRQTPLLLEIAKKLYEASTGISAAYRSNSKDSSHHPIPLFSLQDTFEKKIDWVANRVLDIHKAYPSSVTPTIAIFVPTEEEVDVVAKALGKQEALSEAQISVRPCHNGAVLGDKEQVRVFNIKYIKGLEFDSVLLLDIDRLEALYPELVDKYLYVGLSRATFHLGITTSSTIPKVMEPIKDMFVDGNWK